MQSQGTPPTLAGLSAKEREVVRQLVARELPAVRVTDLLKAHPMPRSGAIRMVSRLHRKGWLRRLKRGVYALIPLEASSPRPAVEEAWLLAMELFAPCYISGWSAAEHWGLTEQIFNSISVASAHRQRCGNQAFAGVQFRVRTIKRERIFGTTKVWFGSHMAEVADPERLLVDILDSPEFGGGGRHTLDVVREYWRRPKRDPQKLLEYSKRYDRGAVFKRLGFTAELFSGATEEWLEECRRHMSSGVSRLDPSGPNTGRIVTRWRLRINLPLPAQ